MARFGEFKAQFFARSNLNTPLSDGSATVRVPVSGETSAVMNGMGRTELTFGHDPLIAPLIAEGNIVICYQYDSLIADPYVGGTPFCLPFKIESATPVGPGLIRIEGPDLLDELLDTQHFSPIGAGTETATTVAVAVDDPATTTLAVGAPHNNLSAAVVTTAGWQEGDEIRITMDNGGVHVSKVWRVLASGGPYPHILDFTDRLPADAAIGNTVERRRRLVEVASGAGAFQVGVECRLTLDNGAVHTTIIADEPDGDIITMRDGAPDSAAVGKAIKATDYSEPTTSDVTKIMNYMVGWSVEFDGAYTGTAAGTHHAPMGDSVYDLLVATAKATGEFFRLKTPGATAAPRRTVVWKRSFDTAGQGGTLRLVQPAQATIDSDAANVNRGIITGDVEREGVFRPVTRIVPLAGDKRISLKMCSEEARLQAMVEGLTLVDSGLGLYTPPYLYNAAAEAALGMIARTVTFSQIRAETDSSQEWISAADAMMRAAIAYLYEHGTGVRYRYTVPDIVCAVPVQPGQRVEMVYTSPDGRWSVNATGADALYVLEARAAFSPPEEDADGILNDRGKMLTLVLAESPWDIPDVAAATAGAIAEVGRVARMASGAAATGAMTIIMSGGGEGGGDHGELTGREDDDHPQYLRADGTRALAGNLAVNSGVTVDGVDISAHAANPDAHHATATAFDASIALSGQAIRVKPGTDSALAVDASGLVVVVRSDAGLDKTAAGLGIKLPTHSGLTLAAAGLAMGTPGTLTAATTNAVTGAGHSHAVTSTSDAVGGTAMTLLASNAEGGLGLARLGVGVGPNTAAALYARAKATDDYTLWLKQLTGQTADIWRVEDVAGNALIRLTGGGDLESGYPGYVSGMTGWQITAAGDSEFNNTRIRGELHAATFVADEIHAVGGTLLVKTVTTVASPVNAGENIVPALNGSFTLRVNASWNTAANYLPVGSIVRVKPMGETVSGGSLDLFDFQLEVTAAGSISGRDLGNGKSGTFALTCVLRLGGTTGGVNGNSTNFEIPAGAAAVLWTQTGTSGYTGAIKLTADGDISDNADETPLIDIFTVGKKVAGASWDGVAPVLKPRVRLGNLRGILGKSADEWGMAAGVDLSDTSTAARYLVASDQGLELRNIDFRAYNGSNWTAKIQSNGAMSLGPDISAAATTTLEFVASTGALRVGPVGTNLPNLFWSGTALQLRQNITPVITLANDGSSYFAGPMTLGTSGGIWQGTGTFDEPTTGIKLYRSGSIGVLETYNGGNRQTRFDTDGAFKAGWDGTASLWNVVVNADGLTLKAGTATGDDAWITTQAKRINWEQGGALKGWVAGRVYAGGQHGIEVAAASGVGIKIMSGPGGPASSYITTDGTLFLQTPTGSQVNINNGVEMNNSSISNVSSLTATAGTFEEMTANDGAYALTTLVLGGAKVSIAEQETSVFAVRERTTHPPTPTATGFVYLYVYRNTATARDELTMKGRTGATVKIAEVAY